MISLDLKNCPFCNGKSDFFEYGADNSDHKIACGSCYASIEDYDKEFLIWRWNMRDGANARHALDDIWSCMNSGYSFEDLKSKIKLYCEQSNQSST